MFPTHFYPPVPTEVLLAREGTITNYALQNLKLFRSEQYMLPRFEARFRESSEKHRENFKKQARQIAACLEQADEYYVAAQKVGPATRPVLLYYCAQSIALAEVLWRGTGDEALDRVRDQNARHGLDRVFTVNTRKTLHIKDTGQQLVAKPDSFGTFSLWHKFARHASLVGLATKTISNELEQTSPEAIMFSQDVQLPFLSPNGISFSECLQRIPAMVRYLDPLEIPTTLGRGTLSSSTDHRKESTELRFILHSTSPSIRDRIIGDIFIDPNAVDLVHFSETPRAFLMSVKAPTWCPFHLRFPDAFTISPTEVMVDRANAQLNEFGFFYVALYILGMLARYYPEFWMAHINQGSTFFLAANYFMDAALERLPVLAFQALGNVTLLPDHR